MRPLEKENPGWSTGAGEANLYNCNNINIPPESQANYEKIDPELKARPEPPPRLSLTPTLARQFFETLYYPYLKETTRPAHIEVRGKREADKDMTFRRFYLSIDLLIKDMDSWPADRHYWFGVALRWSDTKGKKEHCLALTVIFTDVDYGSTGHKKKNRWQTKKEAQAAINAFPIKPTIVVHTAGAFRVIGYSQNLSGLKMLTAAK